MRAPRDVAITGWGRQGHGRTAETPPRFLPGTIPGETVQFRGGSGPAFDVIDASAHRVQPVCKHFDPCGGCELQHTDEHLQADFKEAQITSALRAVGLEVTLRPLVQAFGAGRRRAGFSAHWRGGRLALGFVASGAGEIIDLSMCPVLTPTLEAFVPALRACLEAAGEEAWGKRFGVFVTETETGIDLDLTTKAPLEGTQSALERLAHLAASLDLARVSVGGEVCAQRRSPVVRIDGTPVRLPPRAFLQPTAAGEAALQRLVADALHEAAPKRVIDLFSGCGTFALVAARRASVTARDGDGALIKALQVAQTNGSEPRRRPIAAAMQDLYRRPMPATELSQSDVIILNPPRQGAKRQVQQIGMSQARRLIYVGCEPVSFARDAALLIGAGFTLGAVTPVDQFRWAPHVELVATFNRPRAKRRAGLLD